MNCPRCQGHIESQTEAFVHCSDCGWMPDSGNKVKDNDIQRSSLLAFICITVTLSLAFVHTSTWDQHSVSIIPAKISESLGLASKQQLLDIADMCKDRMLVQCQESALRSALEKNPQDKDVLQKLAHHKMLTKKHSDALTLYRAYFQLGGQNDRATYNYAQLLTMNSEYDLAEQYYVTLIGSKPGVLQLSVNQAFVEMLIKSGQLDKAKKHIEKLRETGAPDYFLNHEYAQINKKLTSKNS